MDNQPASNSARYLSAGRSPWLVVLVVLLFVGFIRVRLLEIPLERDEGEYAYAGQLILQGIPPYELVYNMKLPGTYFAYAAGMAIFGQTTAGVHLTLLVANWLTIVFVFLLARRLFGGTAGLVACAGYGVMSVSPEVLGLAAHATQFVVLFAVPATWLLWKAVESNERRTYCFSGLFYGLAFLMKQQGICFCLFGSIFLLWQAVKQRSIFSRSFAGAGWLFGLGMILPFAFFCFSIVIAGDFERFWFWTFTYARLYATSVSVTEGIRPLWAHLQASWDVSLGFWLLSLIGLPVAWRNGRDRGPINFLGWFWLCSFLGTAIGFYFRNHYFVLMLPAFAIFLGLAVTRLASSCRLRTARMIPPVLFVALSGWAIFQQREVFFRMSPEQISQSVYRSNPFVESVGVGRYLREHSTVESRVAVVGSEPQIYFYAGRLSATGYIYTYPFEETQPYAAAMQQEMIRQIELVKPEYLVLVMYRFSWLLQPASDMTVLRWVGSYAREFYEPVGVVGALPTGQVIYLWDEAARKDHDPLDQYMVIYQRKPVVVPAQ